QSVAAQLPKLRGVPAVTAKQRLRETNQSRLFRDQRHVAVITRNVDDIRRSRSNRTQLSFEVSIALHVRLLADDATAELCEAQFEVFSQPASIRRIEIVEDCGRLCLESIGREVGHHLALKRIDETRAKNVIANLGDGGVRRRRRNQRYV